MTTTATRALDVGRAGDHRASVAMLLVAALVAATLASLAIGAKPLGVGEVVAALLDPDGAAESATVWAGRVPRTVAGLVAGAALGACGALMQAFTRNPLADPGLLGVNAGAALAITIGIASSGIASPWASAAFALVGALVATVAVYVIGSARGSGATPARMTLAGVAIAAVLGAVTTMITLRGAQTFRGSLEWSIGSVGGRDLGVVLSLAPLVAAGLVLALVVAKPLNAWALGDELGRSLGMHVTGTRVVTVFAVTILAGGATAIAGPIGFVGLMVPHAVRWCTGPDQRWIVPLSALAAATLLLLSDVLARVVLPSGELRVGIVTAFLGAPVLLSLVLRRRVSGL